MFLGLNARFLHFACAPVSSSFYNGLTFIHAYQHTGRDAPPKGEAFAQGLFFSMLLSIIFLLSDVLSFVGLVYSLFCSTLFDSYNFPFKK